VYWIKQIVNSDSVQKPIEDHFVVDKFEINRRENVQFFNIVRTAQRVLHYPSIYQLPPTAQCYFLHSHISPCSYVFQCLLTPSAGCLNPAAGPSQHIKYLCAFIVCLINVEVFSFYVYLCIFRDQMKTFTLRNLQYLTDR